mgnify:CR=1 FL=1
MERDKKIDARKAENDDNGRNINSVTELIRFCLKSKSFDLLLVLMIGFVWCGIILLRDIVSGRDSTESLIAIYVWPILIASFFLTMFVSMEVITRKIRKSFSSKIMFALMMLAIPVLMIIIY